MYWTLELASKLEDAPWPASKDELIDYAIRSGSPLEVIENLQEITIYPASDFPEEELKRVSFLNYFAKQSLSRNFRKTSF